MQAQTAVYLDVNGTTNGSGISNGASITWDAATTTNWNTASTGKTTAPKTWNASAAGSKNATFSAGTDAGAAYTVNVSGAITNVGGLTFQEGNVTISGGTSLTLATNPAIVNVAAGRTATVNTVIAGSGFGLTKSSGTGTLVLSGANTYTGTTTISAGTLRATTSASALGAGTLSLGAGTLILADDAGLNFGRDTTVTATTTVTSDRATSGAAVANFTNTLGTLSIGTFTLNTTAGTNVTSGTAGITFGATTLTGTATFAPAAGSLLTLGSVTGTNRSFTVNGAGDAEITGIINSGTGTLTKSGTGTLTLSDGTSTYTGSTTVSGGTLSVVKLSDGTVASSIGSAGAANTNLILNNGTLKYTGTGDSSNRLFSVGTGGATIEAAGTGTLNLTGTGAIGYNGQTGARTLNLTGAGNGILAAAIGNNSGATSLVKAATGSWTLSGTNTYSGTTTVSGGTLQFAQEVSLYNNTPASWTATNIIVNSGATAAFNVGGTGEFTSSDIDTLKAIGTGSGGFLSGSTLGLDTTNAAGGLFTYGSTISDTNSGANSLNLAKLGTGTLSLTNATSSYTGATTISGGTLSVAKLSDGGSTSSIGSAAAANTNLVIDGGTLTYTGTGDSSNRLFSVGTGNATIEAAGTGTLNLTGTGAIGYNGQTGTRTLTLTGAGNGTLAASLGDNSGATSLVKSGTGAWTLSGTNSNTGTTTVSSGTLQFAKETSLYNNTPASWTATNLIVNSGATAAFNVGGTGEFTSSDIDTLKAIGTGSGGFLSGSTLGFDTTNASGGVFSYGSVISDTNAGANALGIEKLGTGTLSLSGNSNYTGTTTVTAGTLTVNSGAAIGAATSNLVVNGGTLNLNNAAQTVANLSGTGGEINLGSGHNLTVNGSANSTWTGNISLPAGNATITTGTNLLTIGEGNVTWNNTLSLGSNTLTFNTVGAPLNTPVFLPGGYTLDPANIVINSTITGTGGITKTGTGTLSLIAGAAGGNTFTGDLVITGGKVIADSNANTPAVNSNQIYIGNAGSSGGGINATLQIGQLASSPAANNNIGTFNPATNASASSLTIYADGAFNMNNASNGFVNLTLKGGLIDGGTLNSALLTVTGGITTLAHTQTAKIQNGNLGMSANNFTFTIGSGASSGVDFQVDDIVQNGVGYTGGSAGTSMVKAGDGKLVFSGLGGANTYSGITNVSAGILNIQSATALGQVGSFLGDLSNGTVVGSGAQLQLEKSAGMTIGIESLTLNGSGIGANNDGALLNLVGNNTLNGYVYLNTDSRINAASGTTLTIANTGGVNNSIMNGLGGGGQNLTFGGNGNTTVNGGISSLINNVVKDGSGTLNLAGLNGYTGATNVTQGAVKVTHDNGLSGSGANVTSGAALQFAQNASNTDINVNAVGATINGTGLSGAGAIQNLNGSNTYQGAITLGSASSIKADAGSTLTLTGGVDVSSASHNALIIGGAGNITETGAIKNGGVTTNSSYSPNGGANTYTVVTGTTGSGGTLEKVDSGTLTLQGGATSTLDGITLTLGNITVTGAGTLVQAGPISSSNASNVLTINSGATVQGFYAGNTITAANTFTGQLAGNGTFQKDGSGILAFNSTFTATNLTLLVTGGEIDLRNGASITVGTLHIAGNTILDFDSLSATALSATNVIIDSGVTVTVNNWASETDFWIASGSFYGLNGGTQTNVVHNTDGQPGTPQSQITFANWSNLNTAWIQTPYPGYTNNEIRPIPEPATYGALFLTGCLALLGWRRYSRRSSARRE